MRVTGRELRVVDGAYDPDPDRIGPPEIYAWMRFLETPAEPNASKLCFGIKQRAYPVVEKGGILWTYLGEGAPPAARA